MFNRHSTIIIFLAFLIVSCESKLPDEKLDSKSAIQFDQAFELIDSVNIDPQLLIGTVRQADVSSTGEILIADPVNLEIYLLKKTGSLIKILNPQECNPGASSLRFARFIMDDRILASTGGIPYVFDLDGNCISFLKENAPFPENFCSTNESIFAYYPSAKPYIQKFDRELGKEDKIELSKPDLPQFASVSRGFGGRMISCNSFELKFLYPDNGDALSLESRSPPNSPIGYKKPPYKDGKDFTTSNLSFVFQDIRKHYHTAIGTYYLNNDERIVVFSNPELDRLNGNRFLLNIIHDLSKRSFTTDFNTTLVLAAKNDILYTLNPGRLLSSGNVSNPVIYVYHYKTSFKDEVL